jgi:antitoxin (DNA-binding transcriptional repressor) of toxin-antitoxin stability system
MKKNLSSHLRRVRAGEEIVIRDRNLPVAKIVPLGADEIEDASLVSAGLLTLPKKKLDVERFWTIGRGARANRKLTEAIRRCGSRGSRLAG